MSYIPTTKNGHNMYDISSMLQKAIRRCDFERAGYAAYELFGSYHNYLWKRLAQISAEDVWGIITKEIVALYHADNLSNAKRKGYDRDPIFIAKAITLLCMARKNRDACYVACNFMVPDVVLSPEDIEHVDIAQYPKLEPGEIPEWVYDVHTRKGKAVGKTDWQMNITEQAALNPCQIGLFDEASWAPRYDYKRRAGMTGDAEFAEHLKFRKGRIANPVEPIEDTKD